MMKLLSSKLTVKQKIILFTFITIVAIISFVNFLYLPQREQISGLISAADKAQGDLNKVKDFMNQHPDIGVYEQEVQAQLDFIDKKLPNTIILSTIMEQVETAVNSSQVTLTRMKPEKKLAEAHYTVTPLLIEFNGNYFQTLEFLKKLEQLDRFSTTNNMIIQSKDGILDCKLLLAVYSYGVQQDSKKQENSVTTSNSYIE